MAIAAFFIGVVAAGIVDAVTYGARRRRTGSVFVLTTVLAIALGLLGDAIARAIGGSQNDVYYFVGFIPTLLAGDALSKGVARILTRLRSRM
ncbi:MAG: hypothetical protein QOC87_1944 [Actinomycetota bacterium]|jgi:hypothetical protein|nr:hypothetical protein [Actinomycetota bacterium]